MFSLQIITQEQTFPAISADSVTLDTQDGQITILPHHIPLFSRLKPGTVIVKHHQTEEHLAISGGFADITPTGIKILADTATKAEDINESQAQAARDAAQAALVEKKSVQEQLQAQISLAKALAELDTVSKWRKARNL